MPLVRAFVRRASRVTPWQAVALAVLLALPSLVCGFALDDHLGRVLARGRLPGVTHAPWDLFRLVGDARMRDLMVDGGWLPWWTGPELRVAFFRPLASLGHYFDYGLWPAWAGHVHSTVLLGAMVGAAAFAYRTLGAACGAPHGYAAIATLLYALDDGHTAAAGWIASQNALAAPALVLLAFALFVRSREGGGKRALAFGLGALALSVGFGETGYAGLGYVAAYVIVVDRAPGRFAALGAYVGLCAVAMIGAAAFGYGAKGSGLYVSPLSDPLRFAESAMTRLPVTLSAVFALPPSDLWAHLTARDQASLAALCTVIVAIVVGGMLRVLWHDALARCLVLGSVFGCVVVSATFPADRMLALAGFGGLGVVARFLQVVAEASRGRLTTGLAVLLIGVHGLLALVVSPLRSLSTLPMAIGSEVAVRSALARPAEGIVVVAAPDPFCTSLRWYIASLANRTPWVQCLVATSAVVRVERVAERTLRVAPLGGFQPTPMDTLTRPRGQRWHAGDRVRVDGMTVSIDEVDAEGRALVAEFTFARPLERLRWLGWGPAGYVDVAPPAVGVDVVLGVAPPRSPE